MAITHQPRVIGHGRKPSGGRYKKWRGIRRYDIGSLPTATTIGAPHIKVDRTKGGHYKAKVLRAQVANVLDPKTKKFTQAKIKLVKENVANREFARRNIITKGAVIETELGFAKVTSRPGQDGTINAVLVGAVEKKK